MLARTGRQRQRYVDQLRLVAGCIPYKVHNNNGDDKTSKEEKTVLVLMISAPNRSDYVFPKGGWEDDETLAQAACREALEEAGVEGMLNKSPIGMWEFRSNSSQIGCSPSGGCRGYMFVLKVTTELDEWPGRTTYHRKWFSIQEAFKHCRYDWMRDALNRFVKAIMSNGRLCCNEERSYHLHL